jgi:hypothetical protein
MADVSTTRSLPSVENVRFTSPAPVAVVTTMLLPVYIALETCAVGAPAPRAAIVFLLTEPSSL